MNNIIVVYLKLLACWVILHAVLSLLIFFKMMVFENFFQEQIQGREFDPGPVPYFRGD